MLKGELENNSRNPRYKSDNWHIDSQEKVQLTLSQGKKKGDEVKDEDDDDAERTSVSQDRVTAKLYSEELFPWTQYFYLSLHIIRPTM